MDQPGANPDYPRETRAYDALMKRTLIAVVMSTLAALTVAAAPAAAAPQSNPFDGVAYAFRCGYLKDVGSSFLDPSCQRPWEHLNTWEGGTYYGRSACEQAGRNILAGNGHARSYRCSLSSDNKYVLYLSK